MVIKMKKIYIVLTHTGTMLSRIIKYYTKDEFSHVSISLDQDLKQMYSFGRLNPYNPFWGGFVHERINSGTFKRFSNTRAKIYSLEVNDEQYEKLKYTILYIKRLRKSYTFNILGLFAVGFNIRVRSNKSFYCAEFVKYVLDKAKIETEASCSSFICFNFFSTLYLILVLLSHLQNFVQLQLNKFYH